MKITKRQLIIESPREEARAEMMNMDLKTLKQRIDRSKSFIQGQLSPGVQYDYQDLYDRDFGHIVNLTDLSDVAKIKASEIGEMFDYPEVRDGNGGILDLSRWSEIGHPVLEGKVMRVTKGQLRRIIKEEWYSDEHETLGDKKFADSQQPDMSPEDLAQAIRDYSKELTGRRDTYGRPDKLRSMSWQELSDYYSEMFNSPEAIANRESYEEEELNLSNDALGYDGEGYHLEDKPLRQGMRHRQESLKRKLRQIIREAITTVSDEEFDKATFTKRNLVPSDPNRPWGSYASVDDETYSDTIMMSPNGDSVLVDGQETYIYDVPSQLHHASGFEMSDTDADNLIFTLETQQQDGYIELGIEYTNGKWSW
jgi:hypothetical protein